MSYKHPIPDAPIALSMLPLVQAENLESDDLMYLVKPTNPIGQRCKALALSVLAQFLANRNLQEITLEGTNGKTLVLNGEGSIFTKPPTAGTLDRLIITEDGNGITIAVTGPTVNRTVKMSQTEISISKTQGGLESKVTLTESGIEISYQTRVEGQVVTTTSTLNSGELDISLLKVLGEDNSDWKFETFKQQSTQQISKNDLLIGEGLPSLAVHIFSKLKVWKQAYFDKDVDINADVTVEKSLKLDGDSSPVLENKKGATNVNSLYFQSAATPDSNSTLQYCSALSISDGQYTLPNHGALASKLGHFKIIANDTNSSVQVYFRSSLSVTLAPGQAAQFLWGGGSYGWFRF